METKRTHADLLQAGERHLQHVIQRCPVIPIRDRDDLAQEARVALCEASEGYDPSRGSERTYSARVVDRRLRELLHQDQTRRRSVLAESLDEVEEPYALPEPLLLMRGMRAFLTTRIEALPACQRQTVVEVYGWYSGRPRPVTQVARSLNITREAVRWRLKLAYAALRADCELRGLDVDDILDALRRER